MITNFAATECYEISPRFQRTVKNASRGWSGTPKVTRHLWRNSWTAITSADICAWLPCNVLRLCA